MALLLSDILIRLSRKHYTAASLSIPDLVAVVIARHSATSPTTSKLPPTASSLSLSSNSNSGSLTWIIWKEKAAEILASGVLDYVSEKDITTIQQKEMMKQLTDLMAECADRHDSIAGLVFMKTSALLLKATTDRSLFTLFDTFVTQKGHECISSLLGCCIDENSAAYVSKRVEEEREGVGRGEIMRVKNSLFIRIKCGRSMPRF